MAASLRPGPPTTRLPAGWPLYLLFGAFPLWWPCVAIAFASVAVGVYLTYALLFVLKEPCPL